MARMTTPEDRAPSDRDAEPRAAAAPRKTTPPENRLEPAGERVIRLDDQRFICVREDGPADGPPLVLLTGIGFDLSTWPETFVRALTGSGHRVLRLDNRDVGRSFRATSPPPSARQLLRGALPSGQYTVEDMAQDVGDTLQELDLQRADVLGFSLGGMIAQALAAHHPRRVRRLISLCSTTGAPSVGTVDPSTAVMLALPGARTRRLYVRSRMVMARHLAGTGFPVDRTHERRLANEHWRRSLDPQHEAHAMRRQIGAIRASGNRTAALGEITAPTLVVHGDRDRIVRPDGGSATAAAVPGARFVTVPGMGHQVHPLAVPRLSELVLDHLHRPGAENGRGKVTA